MIALNDHSNMTLLVVVLGAYFFGMVIGWSPKPFWLFLVSLMYSVCFIFFAFSKQAPANSIEIIPVISMATLWIIIGLFTGRKGFSYINAVGYWGFLFTICSATIGTALGVLTYEMVAFLLELPFGVYRDYNLITAIKNYGPPLMLGFLILEPLRKFCSGLLVGLLWKKITALLTIWGAFSFILNCFGEQYQLNLIWWISNINPPKNYNVFFVFATGLISSFPLFKFKSQLISEPSAPMSQSVRGLNIAIDRENIAYKKIGTPPLKNIVRFQLKLQPGWSAFEPTRTLTSLLQFFIPPGNPYALLRLMVFQYIEKYDQEDRVIKKMEIVSRKDRLKITTKHNVMAHGGTRLKERFVTIHGVDFFECFFLRPIQMWGRNLPIKKFGYVATFFIEDCEFVFLWEANKRIFEKFLPDIKIMAKTMLFEKP